MCSYPAVGFTAPTVMSTIPHSLTRDLNRHADNNSGVENLPVLNRLDRQIRAGQNAPAELHLIDHRQIHVGNVHQIAPPRTDPLSGSHRLVQVQFSQLKYLLTYVVSQRHADYTGYVLSAIMRGHDPRRTVGVGHRGYATVNVEHFRGFGFVHPVNERDRHIRHRFVHPAQCVGFHHDHRLYLHATSFVISGMVDGMITLPSAVTTGELTPTSTSRALYMAAPSTSTAPLTSAGTVSL